MERCQREGDRVDALDGTEDEERCFDLEQLLGAEFLSQFLVQLQLFGAERCFDLEQLLGLSRAHQTRDGRVLAPFLYAWVSIDERTNAHRIFEDFKVGRPYGLS